MNVRGGRGEAPRVSVGVVARITTALVVAVAAWALRPWWHTPIMWCYLHPIGVVGIIATAALAAWAVRKSDDWTFPWLQAGLAATAALATAIYFFAAPGLMRQAILADVEFVKINSLPDTSQVRLVPLAVAERYGRDAHQEPTQKLYEFQPQLWDGQWAYVAGRTPDGLVRYLTKKTNGIGLVGASSSKRSVRFIDERMEVSEGVGITDNARWRVYRHRYFVDLPEVFYSKVNGKVVAVLPVVAYRGFPIRRPHFDGCYIVYPNGQIRKVSAAAAGRHPAIRLAGRAFPEWLARFTHEAYAYRRGIFNVWFFHEDQTEIDDPADEQNGQPYLLATEAGLKWVTAVDPYGNSYAVYKIFVTDAVTGKTEIFELLREAGVTGASQSVGYVRAAFPQYNWSSEVIAKTSKGEGVSGRAGNIAAIEPRPEIIQGKLYWMISVTTTDFKGVERTCFVDGKTNRVQSFTSDEEVAGFLRGEGEAPTAKAAGQPSAGLDRGERIERLERLLNEALRELKALKQR